MAAGMQIFGPDGRCGSIPMIVPARSWALFQSLGARPAVWAWQAWVNHLPSYPALASTVGRTRMAISFAPALGYMSFVDGGNTLRMQFTFSPIANPTASIYYGVF